MDVTGALLPVLQNWSCHNCGGCCREHEINISVAEKKQIEQQSWNSSHGVPGDRPLVVPLGDGWRLNHRDDGACVFLDESGLCRIHSRFGEPAKPLACRLYPYAVHPAGPGVTVSLRFSCPSVVSNLGSSVSSQREIVESLCREVVPAEFGADRTFLFSHGKEVGWADFRVLLAFMERGLSDITLSFRERLLRTLAWMQFLEGAAPEMLSAESLGSLLKVLQEAARRARVDRAFGSKPPNSIARVMFRQFVAQLIRHDTRAVAASGWLHRLNSLTEGLRYTLGMGRIPLLEDPDSVHVAFGREHGSGTLRASFAMAEQLCQDVPDGVDELFGRYFHVKLQGLHFCGPAFYNYGILDGFRSLALMYPATIWTAAVRALQAGEQAIRLADIHAALAILDHNFGYSPVLGMRSSRNRIRQLSRLQQIENLCAHYGGGASVDSGD